MGSSFVFAAPPIEQGRPTLINQPGLGTGIVVTEQQLQQRLDELDRRYASQDGVGQLLNRVMRMENEVRTLRGEVEELRERLRRAESDARERYIDLDRRLSSGAPGDTGAAPAPPTAPDQPTAPAGEAETEEQQRAYRRARDLLAERQYEPAVEAFQELVDTYPDSSLADDAWFWMGEVHTLLREYDDAQVAYTRVLEDFPESDKQVDALFKLGFVAERTGEIEQALDYYQRVVEVAPDSSLASLAEQRVTTLQ